MLGHHFPKKERLALKGHENQPLGLTNKDSTLLSMVVASQSSALANRSDTLSSVTPWTATVESDLFPALGPGSV